MSREFREPNPDELFVESPDFQQAEYEKLRPIRFAMAFSATPETVHRPMEQAGITPAGAEALLKKYADMFQKAGEFARRYGYVLSPTGRKRFFQPPDRDPQRRGVLIQANFAELEASQMVKEPKKKEQ